MRQVQKMRLITLSIFLQVFSDNRMIIPKIYK